MCVVDLFFVELFLIFSTSNCLLPPPTEHFKLFIIFITLLLSFVFHLSVFHLLTTIQTLATLNTLDTLEHFNLYSHRENPCFRFVAYQS